LNTTTRINLSAPWIDERDEELVLEVLRSGWLSLGPTGPRFESLFAEAVGAPYCAAVSSGTAGLHLCMRLAGVGQGDEVITSPYSFVASANCAIYEGATPVFADIDPRTFNLDPAAVEAAITPRTKALFLGYPCNPTGAVLPDAVQDEVAAIAARHDLLVYSDEIYDRLAYGTYRHRAFSSLPGMRDRTILMGGFSKAYAMTGWRVGWLAAPAAILEGIVKVHQYGIMSAPTVAQDAALVALVDGEAEVERMRAEYDRRRRMVVDGLNAIGLETFEPRGAFYAFPKVTTTGLDSETFARRLLEEEHVAVVPGGAFGPSGEGHVRACYATSYEKLEEALVRIGRFVERARAS
jgi:aminotransferase